MEQKTKLLLSESPNENEGSISLKILIEEWLEYLADQKEDI